MTMKRILALTLVVLMVVAMLPATVFATGSAVASAVVDGVATEYENLQEALNDADEGSTVTMMADVVVDAPLVVTTNVILNMDGHTISNTTDIWSADNWSLISVQGGVLVIDGDGTVLAKENDCYAIDVKDGGACTIKNGTFVGNISAVYVYEGSAFIRGGHFSIQQKESGDTLIEQCRMTINCYDANYKTGDAAVLITGGSFANWDPTNNAAEGAGTNFADDGFVGVVDENGNYTLSCVNHNFENGVCTECGKGQHEGHEVVDAPGKEATCTSKGLTDGTFCVDCSMFVVSQKDIPMKEHNFENQVCTECGKGQHEGHEVVDAPGKEATCTSKGLTDGAFCVDCGMFVVSQKDIPMKEHDFENGLCTMCGTEEPTPECDHDYQVVKEEPATCQYAAYVWYECSKCGDEKSGEEGSANPDAHNYVNGVCACGAEEPAPECTHENTHTDSMMPNCSKEGYNNVVCDDCGEILSSETVPTNDDHAFYKGKCLLCGAEEVLPCDHDFVVVKEEKATCVEGGYVWTKCSKCGEEKNYETDPATGEHGETRVNIIESTCVKAGVKQTICKVCETVLSEEELPLSDEHAFHEGKCLLCGAEEILPCDHDFVIVKEQKATCVEGGYVWTKCSKCGEEKNYETDPATGEHGEARVNIIESSCVKAGVKQTICKVCETVLSEEELPLSEEHAFYEGKCLLCGAEEVLPCDHDFVIVKEQKATCVEGGYVWTECSKCGLEKNYETDPATGEHGETRLNIIEANCSKEGLSQVICKICDTVLSEEVLPINDNHAFHEGKCLLCGAEEVLPCEHEFEIVKELKPTCKEAGYVWKQCKLCGFEKNHEVGEPTGEHGETRLNIMESTCVKKGYKQVICKVCDEVLSEEELPLSDEHAFHEGKCLLCGINEPVECEHEFEIVKELAPTCKEAGYVWKQCKLCGLEKNHEVGEPTGEHGETRVNIMESTCVKAGYKQIICKVCDEVLSEEELPLSTEHAFYEGKCLLCGVEESVDTPVNPPIDTPVIPPVECEHDYEIVKELAPTCTEAGYVWEQCKLCGAEKNHEVGEATGEHTWVDATCTAAKTCSVCGATEGDVLGHTYEGVVTAPTCTEKGFTTYTCSVCGDSYVADETDVVDHSFGAWETVKAPTCTEKGEEARECACGEKIVREVDATGHVYTDVTTDATCTEDGKIVSTCACGDEKVEVIPAKGHDFDKGVCKNCGEKEAKEDPKPIDPKPTQPSDPGEEEPSNNKTVIIVVIVVAVLALGVVGFFLVKKYIL